MIRFQTLRNRIFTTLSLAIIFVSLIWFLYTSERVNEQSFSTFDSMNQTINTMLSGNIREYVYHQDHANMLKFLDSIESEYIKDIVILDAEGRVIVSKNSRYRLGEHYRFFNRLTQGKSPYIHTPELYLTLNTFELLDVVLGYLVVKGDINYYQTQVEDEIDTLVLSVLLIMVLAFFVTYYLATTISRPITKMIKTLRNTQENELLLFQKSDEEEFIYLAKVIEDKHNKLLKLNTNLEEKVLEKTEELQYLNEHLLIRIREAVEDVRAKDKLLQQQSRLAQMGEMLSMIAHQWRQPLGALSSTVIGIQTKVQLKKFDLEKSEGREAFKLFLGKKLLLIQDYTIMMTETIDDFRNFYRKDKQKKQLNVSVSIEKALQIVRGSLETKKINIIENYESVKRIDLLENELMQVILNILKNSSDAFDEKIVTKNLNIHTYDTDTGVTIEICDNDGGVDSSISDKIFDPYFSTKMEKNGTGLGLYMSKMIVEEHHNGILSLHNREDGACFRVELALTNPKGIV